MILDCEYCYNHFVIKADDRDVKVNFCPHCGEPINEEEKDGMAWMQASVAVFLDDGTQFFISQDDEGNGPGSIFGANTDGEQWTLPTV